MKYKCLIAEDNLLERDMIELYLGKIDQAEIVAVCEDGLSAMQYLMANEVDIVFTDVDMPQLSGLNLIKSLKHQPVFVFISAYSGYAAEGYDMDGADFIVKPVTPQRLFRAFTKAKDFMEQRRGRLPLPPAPTDPTDIFIRTSDGLQKIQLPDIVYIESKANFSLIHLRNGTKHLILLGLKSLGEQLPQTQFVRIHKLYIINWELITLVSKGSITIDGKHLLPVGDTHRKSVNERLEALYILGRKADTA